MKPRRLPWLISLVKTHRCVQCHRLATERCVQGLGLSLVEAYGHDAPIPIVRIILRCEHCDEQRVIDVTSSLDQLINGMIFIYNQGPDLRHFRQEQASPNRGVVADDELDEAAMRSIHNELKRMSFKRSTKSFQRWINKLDVNLEDDADA